MKNLYLNNRPAYRFPVADAIDTLANGGEVYLAIDTPEVSECFNLIVMDAHGGHIESGIIDMILVFAKDDSKEYAMQFTVETVEKFMNDLEKSRSYGVSYWNELRWKQYRG